MVAPDLNQPEPQLEKPVKVGKLDLNDFGSRQELQGHGEPQMIVQQLTKQEQLSENYSQSESKGSSKPNRRHPSLDNELKGYLGLEKRQRTNVNTVTTHEKSPQEVEGSQVGVIQEPQPIFGDFYHNKDDSNQGKQSEVKRRDGSLTLGDVPVFFKNCVVIEGEVSWLVKWQTARQAQIS